MSSDTRNDDPTHALDGFLQRMQPNAAAVEGVPDLSGLHARLHPTAPQSPAHDDLAPGAASATARAAARAATPAPARGGVLRSGQRWTAADVQDVPVIDLPTVAAEPLPDGSEGSAATQSASRFAASQFNAETLDARLPTWQPDPNALRVRPQQHPRVLTQWQPGAWTGAVRQVLAGSTEFVTTAQGPAVETHAPQHLLLLWPPQRLDAPLLGRWPQQVRLWAGAANVPDLPGADALLSSLPADACLWLQPDGDAVDWALAAEILLNHESGLRPHQVDGLRAFIVAEREANFARLNSAYHQPAAGGAELRAPGA